MEEAWASRYWCHMCSQTVNPITDDNMEETIKCPICQSGFVEEMPSTNQVNHEFGSDSEHRALSLWAPILLGMMGNPRQPRIGFEDNDNHDEDAESSIMMMDRLRRRRSTAAILQVLQGIRAGMQPQNDEGGRRVILINPFNQTIIIQGGPNDNSTNELYNRTPIGSRGDYFMGPGLDMLLQHLAENDPNRYGTPPARKEAVNALPSVEVDETMQCCICLDECEVGAQVKEMPCKHKFHSDCIVPWLELHSSCPVCRYQLPADGESSSKTDPEVSRNSSNQESNEDNTSGNGRRFSIPLVWPFSSLFSSSQSGRRFSIPLVWPFSSLFSSSQSSGGSSSLAASPPRADEN